MQGLLFFSSAFLRRDNTRKNKTIVKLQYNMQIGKQIALCKMVQSANKLSIENKYTPKF